MNLKHAIWKDRLFSSISNLSRTSGGVALRGYAEKPAFMITDPEHVRRQTAENLDKAIDYLWHNGPFVGATNENAKTFVDSLAQLVSAKLTAPGKRLRTWELDKSKYPESLPPEALPRACRSFYDTLGAIIANTHADPVRNAAWIERFYDAELHPLPDGCGRVAKLLGAWILLRDGKYPALFEDRAAYYAAMDSSTEVWEKFYRAHLM